MHPTGPLNSKLGGDISSPMAIPMMTTSQPPIPLNPQVIIMQPVEDPPDHQSDPPEPAPLLSQPPQPRIEEEVYLPQAPTAIPPRNRRNPIYLEIPDPVDPATLPPGLQRSLNLTSPVQRPLMPHQRDPPPLPPRDPLPPTPLERDMQRLQREVLMMEQVLGTVQEALQARHRKRRRQTRFLLLMIFLLAFMTVSLMLFILIRQ